MGSNWDGQNRKRNQDTEFSRKRLPADLTVELLEHMSEEGRFEQTLSQFPNMRLQDLRHTFAWVAKELRKNVDDKKAPESTPQQVVAQFLGDRRTSALTKKVLEELSPEEGCALLRNFGALK